MPFAHDLALDEVAFKLARHRGRAFAAVAYQPNASTRKPLDGRDADLLSQAFGDDLTLVQVDEKDAAHLFSARRAAAIASCAFE